VNNILNEINKTDKNIENNNSINKNNENIAKNLLENKKIEKKIKQKVIIDSSSEDSNDDLFGEDSIHDDKINITSKKIIGKKNKETKISEEKKKKKIDKPNFHSLLNEEDIKINLQHKNMIKNIEKFSVFNKNDKKNENIKNENKNDKKRKLKIKNTPNKKKKIIKEEKVFEVEYVKAYKFQNDTLYFFIKWKNYPEKENTWEPIKNILSKTPIIEYLTKKSVVEQIKKNQNQKKIFCSHLKKNFSDFKWEKFF
jgi:hypothetical protein